MPKSQHVHRAIGLAAAMCLTALPGCKSDGSGGTEPGPTPAISITLSVTGASVPQGGLTQLIATLVRSGGFAGTVNFTVSGAPAGVNGAVSNIVDAGGTSTGTITIQVAANVAPGTYNLMVRGSGTGVTDATAAFALTVTPFGFTITAQPAVVSIQQGSQNVVNIAINRSGGFAGGVALVATGGTVGVTLTTTPSQATGNAATLTIAVSATAATGTYTIGIGAAATGVSGQSATVMLTITAGGGGGGGGNVTVNLACFQILWFAYQDGTGPWTPVTGVNGVFSFNITQARGGFVWVQLMNGVTQTIVQFYLRAEMTAAPFNLCPAAPVTRTINGVAAGLGATDLGRFWLGTGSTSSGTNGAFSMMRVLEGTHDFFAWRHDNVRDLTGAGNPDRAVLRRDQNIPANGSIGNVDFNAGDSFNPASATITLTGALAGENITRGMNYHSTNACTFAAFYTVANPSSTATVFNALGIPAAMQRPTDYHQIFVTGIVRPSPTAPPTATRTVLEYFRTLANRNIPLPAALVAPAITTLTGSYKRMQAGFNIPAEFQRNAAFSYVEANPLRFASIAASLGYIGGPAATLALPDFDGLTGWNNAWPPQSSSTGNWTVSVQGDNLAGGNTGNVCVENGRVIGSAQLGNY
ncbi:MAG: hypothetical protein L0271_20815 [Gemmatimonadetes bacterium]|nr:hypothetical protein [Gemmatimonadota bacterium]